jgi:hypothetical protein
MVLSTVASALIERLIRVGYWSSAEFPDLPDPVKFVDPAWDPDERDMVADYVRRGAIVRAYLGTARCRLCGHAIGSLELSDGVFVWPEGLSHYIEVHHVRLPPRVVDHIHERTSALEEAKIDDAWWRGEA